MSSLKLVEWLLKIIDDMGNMKYYETDLDLVGDNKVLSGKITRHDTLLVERMYNLTSQNDEDVHHNEEMVFENSRQKLKHYILMGKNYMFEKMEQFVPISLNHKIWLLSLGQVSSQLVEIILLLKSRNIS